MRGFMLTKSNGVFQRYARHIYSRMRDQLIGGVTHCATNEKIAALTFDDGPNPIYTPQVLAVLAQYRAKATFFMIGEHIRQHLDVARAVQADGHAIANHTYTHHNLAGCSEAQVRIELAECQRALKMLLGETGKLLRPPYGSYDTSAAWIAQVQGYRMVLWSASGEDWRGDDATLVAQRVLAQTQPGGIVLLHDGWNTAHSSKAEQDLKPDRTQTVRALGLFLPALLAQGYQFVTVTDMLTRVGARPVRKKY